MVANNGIDRHLLKELQAEENVIIHGNGTNVGLAAGLNLCIKKFIGSPTLDSIVLFDQDSEPDVELPERLYRSYTDLSGIVAVGCLGPLINDVKSNRKAKKAKTRLIKVATLATSGTFVEKETFKLVGLMREEFFIDCLDHDWCFRARSFGFESYIDQSIVMQHNMGDSGLNFLGVYKPVHKSPIRHYYIIRNTIACIYSTYVPLHWKISEILKTARRIAFYPIVSSDRKRTLKAICYGLVDGLRNNFKNRSI
jgi:rhamnosyltransferase